MAALAIAPRGLRTHPTELWERLDLFSKADEFVLDDVPDNPLVDPDIVVNDAVAETRHLGPGDIAMGVLEFLGQLPGRFANDFQIPDHRIDRLIVVEKGGPIQTLNVTLDLADGGQDVFEE